ncbi:hypothetical protein PHYPSEUDO_014391 [Phytophthora pseudosyringae]|uniref:Uncharacterized protein n=1 Tax=Phytophthora pseudosyringae TaxID=221518 RepID=A0A8T1W185_9STRA|nr:hypothetical protein PHYPSEUDO_014391 [Phytophthora pseudosyringae]
MHSRLLATSVLLTMLFALAVAASIDSSVSQVQPQLNIDNATTEWPSLRFTFTLKRSSMKIHDESEFSMLADPLVSTDASHVLYNTFATFSEKSTIHNYTLVDGVRYYSSSPLENATALDAVNCFDPELDQLPPINAILDGINQATPVSNAPSGVECSSGNLFKITVNGIDFALCATGASGLKMYGSDVDVAVEYLDKHANISTPHEILSKCATSVTPTTVNSIAIALLTGASAPVRDARRLKAAFDFSWGDDSPSCSCKSTPRPCIFIHGMGVTFELPDNQDSFRYWGNLTGHTPCCSTIKYAVLDTVNNTWTNNTQQQKVCDRALSVSKTSTDTVITDTIVVTHSMGNLLLAAAIDSRKCSLDSSSTWVGLAAPMKGSKASDFIQESCAGNANFAVEAMVENSGRCPPTTALKSMPFQGESYSTPALNAAFTAAQEAFRSNVSALMCSSSFSGLRSSDQVTLWALGMLGHHHSWRNDGMVEFQSCAAGFPESKFGQTWRDRFYRTKLNHYDMQFRHGDSIFSKAKMPLKWFECLL